VAAETTSTMGGFHFTRAARTPRAIGAVALWWAILLILYLVLNAAPLIVLILALFSVPALIDIGAGNTAGLEITDKDIRWHSGKRSGSLPRGQLASVRLDTRLDLTLRMTLLTHQGGKVRLPYECVPKAAVIEPALTSQDIRYERHHFTLLG
jgi:hypothetical protein